MSPKCRVSLTPVFLQSQHWSLVSPMSSASKRPGQLDGNPSLRVQMTNRILNGWTEPISVRLRPLHRRTMWLFWHSASPRKGQEARHWQRKSRNIEPKRIQSWTSVLPRWCAQHIIMAWMTLLQSQMWLYLTASTPSEMRKELMESPISPDGLFRPQFQLCWIIRRQQRRWKSRSADIHNLDWLNVQPLHPVHGGTAIYRDSRLDVLQR